jgi:hypothetical protein
MNHFIHPGDNLCRFNNSLGEIFAGIRAMAFNPRENRSLSPGTAPQGRMRLKIGRALMPAS